MWIPPLQLAVRDTANIQADKSFAVKIATWILLGTTVLMFLTRGAVKFSLMRKLGLDDVFLLFSTIFAIGLSVTSLILASDGLGVSETLTLKRADTLEKGYYASEFLYIAAICFAKLCLIAFFYGIVVQRSQRRVILTLGVFILIWSAASLLATAFQCGLPRPWEVMTLHCYNSGLFWIIYCIIDMTTDVAIIMLSVNLVAYLKVRLSRKFMVVACFAPRILVIGAALARLIYLYPITPHDNPAFSLWVPVIISQIQICLSVSTACIPSLRPFLDIWKMDDLRGKDAGSESRLLKGHQRGKSSHSMNSTAALSLNHGRTTDKSPRIPSPAPLSPLTPPRYVTPPVSRSTSRRSPSDRGLKLQIPPPAVAMPTSVISPQTASSFTLSPQCLSPNPLLSPPVAFPTGAPLRQPAYAAPNSSKSSHDPPNTTQSPDRALLSPVSPLNANVAKSPVVRYSLTPQVRPTPPTIIPRVVKTRQPGADARASTTPEDSQAKHPPRTSSRQQPKFGTGPRPTAPSPTITIPSYYTKTPQTQSNATQQSVPSHYVRTPPTTNPSAFPTAQTLSSPQHNRNQRILSPQNSSRREHISPVSPASPPKTPLAFWREDTTPRSGSAGAETPFSAMRPNRPWEMEEMPVIQDKRSSPRVVLQRPS